MILPAKSHRARYSQASRSVSNRLTRPFSNTSLSRQDAKKAPLAERFTRLLGFLISPVMTIFILRLLLSFLTAQAAPPGIKGAHYRMRRHLLAYCQRKNACPRRLPSRLRRRLVPLAPAAKLEERLAFLHLGQGAGPFNASVVVLAAVSPRSFACSLKDFNCICVNCV